MPLTVIRNFVFILCSITFIVPTTSCAFSGSSGEKENWNEDDLRKRVAEVSPHDWETRQELYEELMFLNPSRFVYKKGYESALLEELKQVPVWSKNSSSLAVSEMFKYCNADELIEGIGMVCSELNLREVWQYVIARPLATKSLVI